MPSRLIIAEASVEGSETRASLLKDIGEGPVGHRIDVRGSAADFVEDEAGLVVLVMHVVGGCVCGAPFSEVQLKIGHCGSFDQLTRVLHASADGVGIGVEDGTRCAVEIEEALVDSVCMDCDEVDWLMSRGDPLLKGFLRFVGNG